MLPKVERVRESVIKPKKKKKKENLNLHLAT